MGKKRRLRTSWLFAAKITGNFPFDFHFIREERTGKVQCSYCGNFFIHEEITRDHVVPKSVGGTYTTPSCGSCNILKQDMMPIQWAIESSLSGLAFGEKTEIAQSLVTLTEEEMGA